MLRLSGPGRKLSRSPVTHPARMPEPAKAKRRGTPLPFSKLRCGSAIHRRLAGRLRGLTTFGLGVGPQDGALRPMESAPKHDAERCRARVGAELHAAPSVDLSGGQVGEGCGNGRREVRLSDGGAQAEPWRVMAAFPEESQETFGEGARASVNAEPWFRHRSTNYYN
jgi:hypothetical protein